MKNYSILILFLFVFLYACKNEKYNTTQARIVERRDIGNNRIRLSYIFRAGQTTVAGVKIIDNSVIVTTDSCKVEYNKVNPSDNTLQLP